MRILFADDSMTAQNMGKKILTEAGYDVVAVSNGAAAVKKIAEQKPDIIILDIYMPGYTGLEVCDKVRGSADTLRTPVLLTVGKMEPYRAEDANRVKADGVIIKPFEASDLLAVIKKLEERVVPRAAAVTEQTIRLERPPEFEDFPQPVSENHKEAEVAENTVQATVDVPDNMATAAAFSDLLGPEPDVKPLTAHAPAVEFSVSPEPAEEPEPARLEATDHATAVPGASSAAEFTTSSPEDSAAAAKAAPVPAWDPSASMSYTASDFEVVFKPSSASAAPASAESEKAHAAASDSISAVPVEEVSQSTTAGSFPDTQPIPVYQEPEPAAEVVTTSPATVEPGFTAQYTTEDTTEAENAGSSGQPESSTVFAEAHPPANDSDSSTNPAEFDSFSAKVEAQIRQIETIVSASEARYLEAEVTRPAESGAHSFDGATEAAPSADDDFEARVAAAMSAYEEPAEERIQSTPAVQTAEAAVPQHQAAPETVSEPVAFEAPYSFEYSPPIVAPRAEQAAQPAVSAESHPPINAMKQSPVEPAKEVASPVEAFPVTIAAATIEATTPAPAESKASSHEATSHQEESRVAEQTQFERIGSELDAQLPSIAAHPDGNSGSDTQMIASVVSRVLERLKPHLIDEIARELREKK